MPYSIFIKRSAQKSLAKIPKSYRPKIIQEINQLSNNPYPNQCKKLTGRDAWRIRIGSYRVIYEINDDELIVLVVAIGYRQDIYK